MEKQKTSVCWLSAKGLLFKQGTLVDATLIAAPPSTKNRDTEMHQTKKGNQWYFGMKAHIDADMELRLGHTVIGTAASVHDVTQAHALLHGEEVLAGGDAGYDGVEKRTETKRAMPWLVAMRPGKRRALHPDVRSNHALLDRWERIKAGMRAKVEHPFRVVKRQFGYMKVRNRRLAKNTAQLHALFMLSNLWMVRRNLMMAG